MDIYRSREERDRLVLDNQALIGWAVKKLEVPRYLRDDARSEAMLKLVQVAEQWKEKCDFAVYAGKAIMTHLRHWLARELREDGVEAITESKPPSDGELDELIAKLQPQLQKIMIRLKHGFTCKEIAAEDGCTKRRIEQLRKQAIEQIRSFSSN